MTSPAQRVFARSSRSLMNFDMSCGGRLHADSRLNKWDLLMSSVSISRISSMSTSIASVGGSYSFCSSSYSHISTASRFRMRLIWCEPYLAVRNFSRRSFTSPFSVKLTRSPVRPGDRSQSFMVSTPHCISASASADAAAVRRCSGLGGAAPVSLLKNSTRRLRRQYRWGWSPRGCRCPKGMVGSRPSQKVSGWF